jgi:3-polyprenyl-4-hydroxybenzoate decarboxylase
MLKEYFADFRDYIGELEKRGKLHRWSRPVNKDTELMPLMRLQYRGIDDSKRQAIRHQSRHGSLWLLAAHRIPGIGL